MHRTRAGGRTAGRDNGFGRGVGAGTVTGWAIWGSGTRSDLRCAHGERSARIRRGGSPQFDGDINQVPKHCLSQGLGLGTIIDRLHSPRGYRTPGSPIADVACRWVFGL